MRSAHFLPICPRGCALIPGFDDGPTSERRQARAANEVDGAEEAAMVLPLAADPSSVMNPSRALDVSLCAHADVGGRCKRELSIVTAELLVRCVRSV